MIREKCEKIRLFTGVLSYLDLSISTGILGSLQPHFNNVSTLTSGNGVIRSCYHKCLAETDTCQIVSSLFL